MPGSSATAAATRWFEQRLTAFDLETTAADPEVARIVTACVVHVGGGELTAARSWLLQPDGYDIPAEASAIHGITTEKARAEGMPAVTAIGEIATELRAAWGFGRPVIVFNAQYDFTVLDRELRRNALNPLTLGPVIDPRVLDKQGDVYLGFHRRGSRKLVDQCAHYDCKLDGAHDAAFDAIAAARLAYRIAQKFGAFACSTPEELHRSQVQWFAEQAASLERHFRSKGKDDVVDRDWPVRRKP